MEPKCESTGKVKFDTISEAKDSMFRFRFTWKIRWQGKRRKHRQRKPKLKRAYYCDDCKGYHLTSWEERFDKKEINNTINTVLEQLIIKAASI